MSTDTGLAVSITLGHFGTRHLYDLLDLNATNNYYLRHTDWTTFWSSYEIASKLVHLFCGSCHLYALITFAGSSFAVMFKSKRGLLIDLDQAKKHVI